VPVVDRLATTARGAANFAVAADGTLAYVNAADPAPKTLMWVDRQQREVPIAAPSRQYVWVRMAPDESRLALGLGDPSPGIAVWDIRRKTLRSLAFASTEFANGPIWTSDSRRIVVQARLLNGPPNLWWALADGSGTAEQLTFTKSNPQRPTGVSPDGSQIVFMEARPSLDVMQVALDGSLRVTELVHEAESYEAGGVVSPNGRWLAYEADVSGRMEIWVRPYPDVTGTRVQVSTKGGHAPRWLPKTGAELFWATPDGSLMRVPVETTGPAWQAGAPVKALDLQGDGTGSAYGAYDIAPDGRIVVIRSATTLPEITLVLHWDQELARLAPVK
jgi:serine/threonine-protein kinase